MSHNALGSFPDLGRLVKIFSDWLSVKSWGWLHSRRLSGEEPKAPQI